jgi:branched-chain amino acid aminotransferase
MMDFHDQDGQIWLDGKLVPWREAKIHVLTHGLHYASCVFEGERVYGGEVFKLTEHTQRLIDSGRILGFEIPWSLRELETATRDAVAAMGYADAYVRPIAWRGSEQLGVSAQQTKIHVAIAAWEWPSYFSPEAAMKGIRLAWADWRRPPASAAPVHAMASGLYMIATLSKHAAEARGFDDALMLDWRGQLAEATGANLFLVQNGKLHTPTPDCFLDGITRKTVIGLAKARQIEVIERPLMPDELDKADEIFVTGTAAEVTPVGEIDGKKFKVGPITLALKDDYSKLVRQAPKAAAAE